MKKFNTILEKIQRTFKYELILNSIITILNITSFTLLLSLLFSTIEYFLTGNKDVRTVIFFTGLSAIIIFSLFQVWKLLKRFSFKAKIDKYTSYSDRIGKVFPSIKDNLTNSIQLSFSGNLSTTSNDLITDYIERISAKVESLNFKEILQLDKIKKVLILNLFFISAITTFFAIESIGILESLNRIYNFNISYIPNPDFQIKLEKDNYNVLKGNEVELIIIGEGNLPTELTFYFKEKQQEDFDSYVIKKSNNQYSFKISSAKVNSQFYAETQWFGSNIQTELGKLIVTERPMIKSLKGKIIFPSYTNQKPSRFDISNADIIALKGSKVDFNITANKEVQTSRLIYVPNVKDTLSGKNNTPDTLSLNVNQDKIDGNFVIRNTGYYFIEIIDSSGLKNLNPVKYSIVALEDYSPSIELFYPTKDIKLDENAIITIDSKIADNFGFSKMTLNYRLSKSGYAESEKDFSTQEILIDNKIREQDVTYIWDLKELDIVPEDEYEFYLEVFDNDIVNGPKSAVTQKIKLKLPSLDEVLADAESAQKKIEKDVSEVLKETQELKKDVEKFKQELRKDYKKREMNWEQKKKAKEIAEKQQQISEKVKKLQENVKNATEQMQKNNALSKETLEKYMKLQELLKQVDIPQLKQYQQNMDKALQDMSPEEMRQAMENMKFDEEQFKKSIERTMKILNRMKAEQKADAVSKLADKLNEDLKKLNEKTEKSNMSQEDKEALSKEQDKLNKDLENLSKEFDDMKNTMSKMEDSPKDNIKQAEQALNKNETQQQMQSAQQNLQKGNKQQASKNQQKSQKNMQKFANQMKQLKEQMQNQVSRETVNKMRKAIKDLLELSKKQEQLKNKTESSNYNSTQLPDINNQQGQLKQSLERVANSMTKLSEKSFALTPEMGKEIGKSMLEMQKSMNELAERRTGTSAKAQKNSMQSLNSAASQMQEALAQMQGQGQGKGQGGPGGMTPGQQGNSSSGGMSFQQRLQQAAAQQQMINNSLQKMMQGQKPGQGGMGGKMSMEQQSEYGRLKNQQGKAKKSLEELAKEQKEYEKDGNRVMGDLNKVKDQMEEVLTDMESGNVNEQTLEKQNQILSRLLNATKSLNQRDYEKKREGKSADQIVNKGPEDLKYQEYLKRISEERLLEQLKQGYTKDFEELIKSYFEGLKVKNN